MKQRTNPVRAAGVLVLTRAEPMRFLLMRHSDRWDLPKGHCDGDETYMEAAIREMQEETGIAAGQCEFDPNFIFDLQYEVTYRKTPGKIFQKKIRYFLAWLPDVIMIEPTEHEGYDWFVWNPPHQIQTKTIDSLLASVDEYLSHGK